MHKIEICDKCKANNIESLVSKIKKLSTDVEIKIGCINFCGICRNKIVILFDHMPIIGTTEEEILNMIKDKV